MKKKLPITLASALRYQKRTQELPNKEIEQAKKNMDDFILRYHQGEFDL